jgi:hypothetical protein
VDGINAVLLLARVFDQNLAQPFNDPMLTPEVTGFEIEKRQKIKYKFSHCQA